jgi:hypothetical protein
MVLASSQPTAALPAASRPGLGFQVECPLAGEIRSSAPHVPSAAMRTAWMALGW